MHPAARKALSLFVSCQILSTIGYGQTNQNIPVRISDEIVVTATRYEERVASVPGNVSVISRSDIANSTAQDIPSLLRSAGGVQVVDIGGNQRRYRVDLRGFGETAQSNTLVLIDGRRVNQADLSGTDWVQIPLNRVERIEIVRGGRGSVLYGDNAAGGIVNIITRSGDVLTGGGDFRAGSYNTVRADAYLGGSQGDFTYAVSGNLFSTDGYRDNSAVKGGDLGGSIQIPLGEYMGLGISAGYHSDKAGLPGALKESDFKGGAKRTDSVFPNDFADAEDYYVLLRPEFSFLSSSLARFDFSFRKRDSLFFSSFSSGNFEGNTDIDTYTFSPQVVLQEPIRGLPNTFTAGFDYVRASEDITNTTDFFSGIRSVGFFNLKKENSSFFFHDELFPVENLALSGGFRHDRVNYLFSPSTPDSRQYNLNLFTAGANYRFNQESHLYFSFSRSFRYPLLDELFNFFSNTIDPTLGPQRSDNLELGFRHFFSESFYGNINYFLIDTENEIFFNPAGGPFGFGGNENFDGPTRRTGVELAAGGNLGILNLQGSYSYSYAQVREGQYRGSWIPSVPRNSFTLSGTLYVTTNLTIAADGIYSGRRPFESDWSNSFGNQSDHFLLNSRISYNWQRYRVYLDINNLLNQEYSDYGILGGFPVERAFYPSPKANFLLGFSLSF
jgi:iron complex outermembrane receptor protein